MQRPTWVDLPAVFQESRKSWVTLQKILFNKCVIDLYYQSRGSCGVEFVQKNGSKNGKFKVLGKIGIKYWSDIMLKAI